jgi:hypothetical protein
MTVGSSLTVNAPLAIYRATADSVADPAAVASNARVATFDAAVAQQSSQPRIRGIGSKINELGQPTGVVTNILV